MVNFGKIISKKILQLNPGRAKDMENEIEYKREIIKMLEMIEDASILIKILTVVKTHLVILREREQD